MKNHSILVWDVSFMELSFFLSFSFGGGGGGICCMICTMTNLILPHSSRIASEDGEIVKEIGKRLA